MSGRPWRVCKNCPMTNARKMEWDIAARMEDAKAAGLVEGRAEGLAKGRAERDIEFARDMMTNGEPIEKITRYTGLPREELEALR